MCRTLLPRWESLQVLAILLTERITTNLLNEHNFPELAQEPRIVVIECPAYLDDWTKGALTGLDYWSLAENLIVKRKSGEINRLSTFIIVAGSLLSTCVRFLVRVLCCEKLHIKAFLGNNAITACIFTFKDSIPITSLTEGFRVFTKPAKNMVAPPAQQVRVVVENPPIIPERVYIDAACRRPGDADAKAGFGVFFSPTNPHNTGMKVPMDLEQSLTSAVILGTIWVLRNSPLNTPLHILSGRDTIVKIMKSIHAWEDRGWNGSDNFLTC
ncbi:hypothetical protein K438DRAFT_1995430 [Mycena galopus ATCC 62051]|nr:hypothetical protein K438DRAFT_1995430 [Mycena galopus ATCC 62051]